MTRRILTPNAPQHEAVPFLVSFHTETAGRNDMLAGRTLEQLREQFSYDPIDGLITRRITTSANARAGDIVGSKDAKGYLHVSIRKRFVDCHRLAFLLHHGWLPPEVDHRNRARADNRIDNLRAATRQFNVANTRNRGTSGYRGVSRSTHGRWQAQIKINGKQFALGLWDNPALAHEAYCLAAHLAFGEFASA